VIHFGDGKTPFPSAMMTGWRKWISVLMPGAGGLTDAPEHLRDAQLIISAMLLPILFGLIAIAIDCGELWTRGLIIAAACLAVGCLAGFLFGIPKVLQGDQRKKTRIPYEQRVNTNLEEISDWLTKIIVGLGLYELKEIPAWVGRLAKVCASGFQNPGQQQTVFGAAVLFFPVCGFLLSYLVTRLYLQGALSRADQAARPDLGGAPKESESKLMNSESDTDEPGMASTDPEV
jgi:hypothetical protein